MARSTSIALLDDLDGTPAVVTHVLALDDRAVVVDLSAENARRLRDAVEPFLAAGRTPARRRNPGKPRPPSAIRAWALDNGMHVSERGRIPAEVLRAYVDALATTPAGDDAGTSHRR
jgi:hypothetical protein